MSDKKNGDQPKRQGLKRRSILLGSTSLAAAPALGPAAVATLSQAAGALLSGLTSSAALAQAMSDGPIVGLSGSQLPKPDPEFTGKIGETLNDSTPSYPPP